MGKTPEVEGTRKQNRHAVGPDNQELAATEGSSPSQTLQEVSAASPVAK